MVIIEKYLSFKLYKNNNLKIFKNNIAYSIKNDKILFELDDNIFSILIKDSFIEFEKNGIDNIFKLNNNKASIYLKEHDLLLPIIVEEFNLKTDNNNYIITYQLETDDEQTTIEIIL